MISDAGLFRCISCYGKIRNTDGDRLECISCGDVYPVIDGIPVFLPHATSAVASYHDDLETFSRKVDKAHEELRPVAVDKNNELSERAVRILSGHAHNIALMKDVCCPIFEYSSRYSISNNPISWALTRNGYPYEEIIKYFYQDWGDAHELTAVRQLFEPAIEKYCKERNTLAVLGTGACGLLYWISKSFDTSFGIDLSLSGLLIAKRLISGGPISLYLENADWTKVVLTPPGRLKTPNQFVVSSVMTLPFPENSVSLITTQYLLDIVPNTAWFIDEIHRVLKPGGIWMNFSKPFRLPSDPPVLGYRRLNETTPALKRLAFDVIETKTTRFHPLNPETLYCGGDRFDQEAQFVVAKKITKPEGSALGLNCGRISLRKDLVWEQVPCLIEGRDLSVIKHKSFSKNGVIEGSALGVGTTLTPVNDNVARIIGELLALCDGKLSLKEIWRCLDWQGNIMNENEFIDLVRCLNIEHFLLTLN